MGILDIIATGGGSPLETAKAGGQGAQAGMNVSIGASELASQALGRRVKQAELDEWLESAPTRKKLRTAQGMEAEEFVSPLGQEQRREQRETSIVTDKAKQKLSPYETNLQVRQLMSQTHQTDQADLFYRTQHLTADSSQEDYSRVFKDLPDSYAKALNLTGNYKQDMQTIGMAQAAAKDNLPHLRRLEELQLANRGKGKGTYKTPPPPAKMAEAPELRMYVAQDSDLNNMASWWKGMDTDEQYIDQVASAVGVRADSIANASHQRAVYAINNGQYMEVIQPQEAMKQAMTIQKALLHDARYSQGRPTYLTPEEALVQQNTWTNNTAGNLMADKTPMGTRFRTMTGMQKTEYLNKIYETYMVDRYQRLMVGRGEGLVYGK